jgi:dihydrofolate reductase
VVERVVGTPAAILDTIGTRGFGHVYVDGANTIQQFLAAGLVQRLIVTRVPILIGSGIPLFGLLQKDILLRHVATRTFAGGLVQTEYAVAA